MGTGAIVAVVAGVVVAGGATFWWLHSQSKAGAGVPASKPQQNVQQNSGWVGTVTGVSGAAKDLSSGFVNVTQGIGNLVDTFGD